MLTDHNFENRVFSFHDVIALMDSVGVGYGATIHLIQRFDMDIDRDVERGRRPLYHWDFPKPLTEEQIESLKGGELSGDEWEKLGEETGKVKALNTIADRLSAEYPQRRMRLASRFEQWGDSTSRLFLEAMEKEGYDLVRKKDDE